MSPETRLVFSVRETPDRASLDALTAAALNSANDFPTASAVCGGRAVTMEYAHSRAEVTFAVWTTSQQVAATVGAAVAADAFIGSSRLSWAASAARDAASTSSAVGEENAEACRGPAASLEACTSLRRSLRSIRRDGARKHPRRARRALGHRADALPDGGDPHAIARELAPALDEALASATWARRRFVRRFVRGDERRAPPGLPRAARGRGGDAGRPRRRDASGTKAWSHAQACAAMAVDPACAPRRGVPLQRHRRPALPSPTHRRPW